MKKKKEKNPVTVVSDNYSTNTSNTFPVSYSMTTGAIDICSVRELDKALSNINETIDKVANSTNQALEALVSVQHIHDNKIKTNHDGLHSLAKLVGKHNECLVNHQEIHERVIKVITQDGNMLEDLYKKHFDLIFKLQIAFFINFLAFAGIVGFIIYHK